LRRDAQGSIGTLRESEERAKERTKEGAKRTCVENLLFFK